MHPCRCATSVNSAKLIAEGLNHLVEAMVSPDHLERLHLDLEFAIAEMNQDCGTAASMPVLGSGLINYGHIARELNAEIDRCAMKAP